MGRGDAGHPTGDPGDRHPVRGTLVLLLVLALVVGGIAAWRYDLLDRFRDAPDPGTEPAAVAPPPGVTVPGVVAPPAVAAASATTRSLDPAAVRRTLAPYLRDRDLGRHVLAEVAPLEGGPRFTSGGPRDTAIPASTTKVVTSTAALLALGPDHTFTTEVRRQGRRLVLVGGGDPLLERGPRASDGTPWAYPARATLSDLAAATKAALAQEPAPRALRLDFDDSLFSGPAVNPTWEADYVPDSVVSPTSALWVDEGRSPDGSGSRVADPAAEAARSFAAALAEVGVTVRGTPTRVTAPDVQPLASVESAPLGSVVERVLGVSDNEAAEVLLRHVGLARAAEGSIAAGREGVRTILAQAGVPLGRSVFHDGSGLSRANRADPSTLVGVLQVAASADHPELRHAVTGLPVAAFTGSLADRMSEGPPAGRGRVQAKTGTLEFVRSLAGLATMPDGTVVVFALMADRIPAEKSTVAQVDLDSAAAALGACSCGS
ncbi:D-alanyl-D-alanine carboxypeptidase/D-alanyl-D-alanine endopeptidase [Nocardioides litoris]|uniref:D-alanyl-D-alanine carboxypeptidase/D-alanyl-D-alanine endopeptidase n=1 Tax=Nocardioides litoris TaxID=1926648 RepID=UPI0011204033|nr:D-alanyl-D-alanine carboxypeptidase/D-alanyl-D-alanine-endopeptidase [Nocardioides litoris]